MGKLKDPNNFLKPLRTVTKASPGLQVEIPTTDATSEKFGMVRRLIVSNNAGQSITISPEADGSFKIQTNHLSASDQIAVIPQAANVVRVKVMD